MRHPFAQNDIHRKSTALRKLEKELQARVMKVDQLEEEVLTQRSTVESLRGQLQQSRQDAVAEIAKNGGTSMGAANSAEKTDVATSPMACDAAPVDTAEVQALHEELDYVVGQLKCANRVRNGFKLN